MANMFLKLTNIHGKSRDHKHHGEIEIHDWDWGIENAASFRLEADKAAKQTQVDHVFVHKMFDRASPTLMNYCAYGRQIDEAVITCRKNDGDHQVEYLKIILTGVKVDGVKWAQKGEDPRGIPEIRRVVILSLQGRLRNADPGRVAGRQDTNSNMTSPMTSGAAAEGENSG